MDADDTLLKAAACVPASNSIASGPGGDIEKSEALALYFSADALPARRGLGEFDPRYYARRYPEIIAGGRDPRKHYFRRGAREGRFPNEHHEVAAAMDLLRSGLIKVPTQITPQAQLDYVLSCLRGTRLPRFAVKLNQSFIRIYYPYSRRGYFHELQFLNILFLRKKHLRRSKSILNWRTLIAQSALFDTQAYHRRVILTDPLVDSAVDPILYYITEGWRRLASPAQFSDRAYLVSYPDVIAGDQCPMLHYLLYGQHEGRERVPTLLRHDTGRVQPRRMSALLASAFTSRQATRAGGDPLPGKTGVRAALGEGRPTDDRRKVLFVTHEASRTGAPLLALDVCRSLAGNFDLVVASVKESGTLDADFAAAAPYYAKPGSMAFEVFLDRVILAEHDVDVVIINTLACGDAVADCAARGLKVLLLVHDFPAYLRPLERICRSLLHCESAVFPSDLVRVDAFRAISRAGLDLDPTFGRICHQGRVATAERPDPKTLARLDAFIAEHAQGSQPLVIMGAGYAQQRKGVTLFVDACADVLRRRPEANIVFVWVGEGYVPWADDFFSIFLSAQIERQSLRGRVLFLGETTALSEVFSRADGFMLTSLLDPFPNVAIDALCHGMPLICFEQGTGIADLKETFPDLVDVVPYRDVSALGAWTLSLLDVRRTAPPSRRDEVRAYFDPARYNAFIKGEVQRLRKLQPMREDAPSLAQMLDLDVVRGLPEMRFGHSQLLDRDGNANLLRTFLQLRAKHATLEVARDGKQISIERCFPHRTTSIALAFRYRSYALLDAPVGLALNREPPTCFIDDNTAFHDDLAKALDPVPLAPFEQDSVAHYAGYGLIAAIEGGSSDRLAAKLRRLINAYLQDGAQSSAGGCLAYATLDPDFDFRGENPEGLSRPSAVLLALDDQHLPLAAAYLLGGFPDAPTSLRRLLRLAHALGAQLIAPVPRDLFPVDVRQVRPVLDLIPLPT